MSKPISVDKILEDSDSWHAYFNTLSDEKKQELAKMAASVPGLAPLPGPQTDAYMSDAKIVGLGGAGGGGKGSTNLSTISTPFGFKTYGEIRPGDIINDAYGGAQRVLRVKNWGMWDMRKVTFSDGTSVIVSPEHEWLAWRSGLPKRARTHTDADQDGRLYGAASVRKIETDMILREMNDRDILFRIPLCEPVVGNHNSFLIDGYLLGAFLGDGHLPNKGRGGCHIDIHEEDVEILDHITAATQGFQLSTQRDIYHPNSIHGYLSTKSPDYTRLRDMGMLGKRAWEKHLPEGAYKAPIEWRWSLLQGLMDTDGWVEPKRCAYYTTTSPQLRDDVTQLARSLGCFVTITDKHPTFTYKGEKKDGRPAYTLRIKSATPEKLFRLRRKRDIAETLEHQSLAKEIVNIETVPRDECICISVDHPGSLYVTSDFTVTHNSFLIALLAILKHRHSVVFRYDKAQLAGLINDLVRGWGSSNGLNRGDGVFRFGEDHFLEYGGIGKPLEEENWQGRAHDLIALDEVTQLTLNKVEYVMGWLRTTIPGLIPKIIMTMNPPRSPTGRWVIPYFAPWLDKAHPDYPAQPGKKYWYYRDEDGEQIELSEEPEEKIHLRLGDQDFYIEPESKTFFPARVWHNKYLVAAGYQSHLASRPKAERDMLLLGDFQAAMQDDDDQLIPTQWVEDAMRRWEEGGHHGDPMDAIGVDVARGGVDLCVFSRRHALWWDKLVEIDGRNISSGRIPAQKAVELRRNQAKICVDSIGDGSGTYDMLADPEIYNANPASVKGSVRKNLPKHIEAEREFYNLRTVLAWTLRRILDPDNGFAPALPPSPKLRDEITAHHYAEVGGITKLEIKDSVKVTLGHSPDHFDSIMYSLYPIAMRDEEIAKRILPPKRKKPARVVTELNLPKHTMDPYRYLRSHR